MRLDTIIEFVSLQKLNDFTSSVKIVRPEKKIFPDIMKLSLMLVYTSNGYSFFKMDRV